MWDKEGRGSVDRALPLRHNRPRAKDAAMHSTNATYGIQFQDSYCFVYIVSHVTNGHFTDPVKVGITHSMHSRLASLQTGNSQELSICFYFLMPSRKDARCVEREFHETFSDLKLRGEWFDMDPLYALETLTAIVYGILEERYEGERREFFIRESNAPTNLNIVKELFWRFP